MAEIKIDDLKELCLKALTRTGLSPEHAEITVDHYLENECSGKKSHGMVRIPQLVDAIKMMGLPVDVPEITNDKGNTAIINAHMNLGPMVGKMVLDESVMRAKQHGLSFVGMKNYFGNTGSMAYYMTRLAENGLIGLMSCSSECMVTAPAGKERFLGTNPIGLAVPSEDGNHFIADFATSAIAFGKVMVAKDKGEDLPAGCIIDKDGNPSTNPNDAAKAGAILPLADYRGFALGLFVEMIGLMIGGEVLHNVTYGKDGFFIIAIDPKHLGSTSYAKRVSKILSHIRNSDPAPNHNNVSIPGDRSAKILKDTLATGMVDVTEKTLQDIQALAT